MRVSSKSQDDRNGSARQRAILLQYGVMEDHLYYDVMTGRSAKRPALDKLLAFCREGDTVVVSELSRLGRNTRNCLELVEKLNNKGVALVCIKEGIDTNTDIGQFFLTVCSAFNELELSYINERCKQGLEVAKAEGRLGRPKADKEKVKKALELYKANKETVKEISKEVGISESVIYRSIKKYDIVRDSCSK